MLRNWNGYCLKDRSVWWYRPTKSWDFLYFLFFLSSSYMLIKHVLSGGGRGAPWRVCLQVGYLPHHLILCSQSLARQAARSPLYHWAWFLFSLQKPQRIWERTSYPLQAQNTVEIWNPLLWTRALWEKIQASCAGRRGATRFSKLPPPSRHTSMRFTPRGLSCQCRIAMCTSTAATSAAWLSRPWKSCSSTLSTTWSELPPCVVSVSAVSELSRLWKNTLRQATWNWVRLTFSSFMVVFWPMGTSWQWGTPPWLRTIP